MRNRALALGSVAIVLVVGVVSNVAGDTQRLDSTLHRAEQAAPGRGCQITEFDDDFGNSLWPIPMVRTTGSPASASFPSVPDQPGVTNTPAPPVAGEQGLLNELPLQLTGEEPTPHTQGEPARQQMAITGDRLSEQASQRVEAIRRAGARIDVHGGVGQQVHDVVPQASSDEVCYYMLLNPELDVVELGGGMASIEYWSIPYPEIYWSKVDSPSLPYSLVMGDEGDLSLDDVLDPFYGTNGDYDMFGQGFRAPSRLTYLRVNYSRANLDANESDVARSGIWSLEPDGQLNHVEVFAYIPDTPLGWQNWQWELRASGEPWEAELLNQLSGQTLALIFDMLSDRTAPGEYAWIDDAQVTLCWERGSSEVYLPLVARKFGTSSGPTCAPREPDSVNQMGKTVVGATCGGALGPVDEKDYFALGLGLATGAQQDLATTQVRLRLFDMPEGTNWDAHIYQRMGGGKYDLKCYTGDQPYKLDKSVLCDIDPHGDNFVLINRGDETIAGTYQMSVKWP